MLNLEAVLPNGEMIHTGANTLKNATGYDLTRLVVGSEGTLAVVTKITLKLLAYPKERLLMLAPFSDKRNAITAVNEIMQAGITPSALEFMERDAILCAVAYLGESPFPIGDDIEAQLLIEIDGNNRDQLYQQVEDINKVLENLTDQDILFADDSVQEAKLWKLRRIMGEAAKSSSIYKEEDTVVPRAALPDLLDFVKETGKEFGFKSLCYGHTGDGNLHVNILKNDLSNDYWQNEIPKALKKIFTFVQSQGGTISGEHGIGLVQKEYLPIVFNSIELNLMKEIKKVFDPNGILNPGKIFPSA